MTGRNIGFVSLAGLAVYLSGITPAEAYLDPGTGSIIVQGIIGAVAGGLVLMKVYWQKIKRAFSRKPVKKPVDGDEPDQT